MYYYLNITPIVLVRFCLKTCTFPFDIIIQNVNSLKTKVNNPIQTKADFKVVFCWFMQTPFIMISEVLLIT